MATSESIQREDECIYIYRKSGGLFFGHCGPDNSQTRTSHWLFMFTLFFWVRSFIFVKDIFHLYPNLLSKKGCKNNNIGLATTGFKLCWNIQGFELERSEFQAPAPTLAAKTLAVGPAPGRTVAPNAPFFIGVNHRGKMIQVGCWLSNLSFSTLNPGAVLWT